MLAVNLVTWPPYPEAQPCDVVGGMLFRVLWVQEGGRIHSALSGKDFNAGVHLSLFYGDLLIVKSCVSGDVMVLVTEQVSSLRLGWLIVSLLSRGPIVPGN